MPIYDVFLSHAGSDKSIVEALARKLRDVERLRVFFDRWELVPGTHWQEALEKALAESRTCAVFLGPEGLGPWHTEEMRAALGQRVAEEPKRVIPVLLPGAREEDIPRFLSHRTWVDFRAGLDDESAFRNLVAGIRGVAPGGDASQRGGPEGETPVRIVQGKRTPLWSRLNATQLGIVLGIVGILATLVAWLWPRTTPAPDLPPDLPALYSVRVQVLDPQGRPLQGSLVRVSAGNEPHLLPDGWWEVQVPAAKLPEDRKLTIWAEHPRWDDGRADHELGMDPNPQVEVRLKRPQSRLSGVVRDSANRSVAGARVTAEKGAAEPAVTDQDGRFELAVSATEQDRVRIHVEHVDFPPKDSYCYPGSECSVYLGDQ